MTTNTDRERALEELKEPFRKKYWESFFNGARHDEMLDQAWPWLVEQITALTTPQADWDKIIPPQLICDITTKCIEAGFESEAESYAATQALIFLKEHLTGLPLTATQAVAEEELEKLGQTIALSICERLGHDPDQDEEWYSSYENLYNTSDQFKELYRLGYRIAQPSAAPQPDIVIPTTAPQVTE